MTTVAITDISGAKKKGKEWGNLQKLWNDIEKKQARNNRYEKKLEDFLAEFKQHAEEAELGICLATEKFIRHLIKFIPRKTIKGSQRERLYEWIEDEFSILESNPFNRTMPIELREEFAQALIQAPNENEQLDFHPDELDNFREELQDMIGEDFTLSNDELVAMLKDPARFKTFLEEYMQQHTPPFDDEGIESDFEFEDEIFEEDFLFDDDDHQAAEKKLAFFQTKEITKLYRQLAKQLHPDRELDTEKKEHKKTLMQQLSLAKQEKDTFAMLMLAQEHLPDFVFTLDKSMLADLEDALKGKLAQLNLDYEELQYGPDLKTTVWRKFGGGNKLSREKTIAQYVMTLNDEIEVLLIKMVELRTVKDMQQALREREQENDIFGAIEELFIDL